MSDMAEDFRVLKQMAAERKAKRFQEAIELLEKSEFVDFKRFDTQSGTRIRFGNQRFWLIDYWPATSRWHTLNRKYKGFGIATLLAFMRKINESKKIHGYRVY